MNILQINTRYIGGGGAASIANSIHNYINNNTDNNSVFLYGRGKAEDEAAINVCNKFDIYMSALSNRFFGKSKNVYFSKEIENYIKKADVIHLHNIHGYYIDMIKLIKLINKHNKPVVWTLHDEWPFTGSCAFPGNCTKWIDGCSKCEHKYLYPARYIDRSKSIWMEKKHVFNLLNKEKVMFVSPSRWLAEEFKKSFLKQYNITVIPNGVDNKNIVSKSKFELKQELKLPLDKKVVLFVAADPNDERKGIKYLFKVLDNFNDDIVFISVGKIIKDLKYKNLIQLGYISNKAELNKIYKASDVFLSTSIEDNFPTTIIEAFSNSLPVIAFDVGGIGEQLENECGILIEKCNHEQLKKAIVDFLGDEEKIKQYSINAFNKYKDNYMVDKFVNKYIEIYKTLNLIMEE
ncbi:glycosyltransferase [Clostridium hydrogenum]|uniref:glycosyltransferase n=1 Tax=Clostridium hydrogenum TaxID=2855764 RepID=UPI001F3A1F21|nr:glycosyltransferase [Clostridium hydrogenum]